MSFINYFLKVHMSSAISSEKCLYDMLFFEVHPVPITRVLSWLYRIKLNCGDRLNWPVTKHY